MRKLIILLFVLSISCRNTTKNTTDNLVLPIQNKIDTSLLQNDNSKTIPDSINTFKVDDYPVTNEMLRKFYNDNPALKIQGGNIFSLEKVWFTNDTLNQTLVFELYTDFHRFYIYHFQNDNIPSGLIKHMTLYVSSGNEFKAANYQQKETFFQDFVKSSKRISQKYFTTKKGFNLNDSKAKAIKVYGQPDKKTIENGIECYEWNYFGDYIFNSNGEKIDLKGKPVAKDSFGYHVIMYFDNEKLISLILSNDIP